jgi:tetratricopeptide (TPR) repeat protein
MSPSPSRALAVVSAPACSDAACVAQVEAALAAGDLVTASAVLDAHDAAHSQDANVLLALARVMRLRGQTQAVGAALERAISLDAQHELALVARACLAQEAGEAADACAWFARAWAQASPGAGWVPQWLELLLTLGRREEALAVARLSCARATHDADGWFWLGYTLQVSGQLDQALEAYGQCARRGGHPPQLHNNMAAAYLERKDLAAARAHLDEALKVDPLNGLAWTNLALWWLRNDHPQAARVAGERALALMPGYAIAWQNYSNTLRELQEWDAAMVAITRAAQHDPVSESIRWSLAMLQLVSGNYAHGWVNHEARWQGSPELRATNVSWSAPRWSGQPLAGRTLLVWSEQGYGDVLQFVRFVPAFARWVRRQGGELVLCTFGPLMGLVARRVASQVKAVVLAEPRQVPAHDFQLPLASLPLALGVKLADLPHYAAPYLIAEVQQVKAWRARCAGEGLKVGLVWSGSRLHQRNTYRSVAPYALARALARVEGVRFYSLQVDAREDELAALTGGGLAFTDLAAELATFDDTAACVQQLDLVITVCTSTAHLAGALGVPTWLMLDVNPHWTWLTGRSDSPWYHSVKLYRQEAFRQWAPVLARLARDLAALARPARGRRHPKEVSG